MGRLRKAGAVWLAAAMAALLIASGCRGGRSKSIRNPDCCAAFQHSDVLPGQPEPGVIRLAAGGDSRDDRVQVVPWAFQESKRRGAQAFLFLGDLEMTRAEDRLFKPELKNLGGIAFYPVIGNHEIEFFGSVRLSSGRRAVEKFREEFLPKTGIHLAPLPQVVYSAEIAGRIHFIALDNVSQRGEGLGGGQLTWLEDDLKAANAARRIILVGMHKALAKNPITTHAMDEDGPAAIRDSDAALALFQQYGVALALVSHSHMFAAYNQNGVEMRLTGGLGAPLVKGLAERDGGFHHFLLIDIAPDGKKPVLGVEVVRFPGAAVRDETDESEEVEK